MQNGRFRYLLLTMGFTLGSLLFASLGHEGTYWVPGPAELSPYSTFILNDTSVKVESNTVSLHFSLPPELIQAGTRKIDLVGQKDPGNNYFMVKGANTLGQCQIAKLGITCLVSSALSVDVDAIESYLKVKYPTTYDPRIRLLRLFGNDPGGVVHFDVTLVD